MVTLNRWFFKNTKLPLLILGGAVALVQISFVFYTHNKSKSDQEKAIRNLASTVANIGIEQGNRPLLESAFQLAIEELGVKAIVVCNKGERIFHEPVAFGRCPNPSSPKPSQSILAITPSGFRDYRIYFYVDRFQVNSSLIWLNIGIFLLLCIVFHIIYRIQQKLTSDILIPLEGNFSGPEKLQIKELNAIKEKFEEYRKSKEQQAVAGAILEHNLSIGHNIKSLQQTLEVLMDGEFSSDRQKERVQQLAKDIKSIMAKLADQTPDKDRADLITSDETFFEYLEKENQKKTKVNLVESLEIAIEHKLIEMTPLPEKPSIRLNFEKTEHKAFIEVVGPEFRDVLSNLMNNSTQAGASEICLDLVVRGGYANLRLTDNGCGIPKEIQDKIFTRGFTSGKENGTGYGLFHAKKFVESWGGTLELEGSEDGLTQFMIRLPIWRIPDINLRTAQKVIVLDDEERIHEMWRHQLATRNPAAQILSFYSKVELIDWFETQENYEGCLFLFDSHLGVENSCSGEDLIENLGIANMAHLVTSKYGDSKLSQWCEARGISLVPKEAVS